MQLATSSSTATQTAQAVDEAMADLLGQLGGPPDFLFVASSAAYDLNEVIARTRRAGTSKLHGSTSCRGAMSDRGLHSQDGKGLAVLGIRDPHGAYGSALAVFEGDAFSAGRSAVDEALRFANRPGEVPSLILMNASPGQEERVIEGIQSVVGPLVPILGGSAADNEVAGEWRVWTAGRATGEGVALSVLFPSVEISFAFRSGYVAEQIQGTVTRASGRCLAEIDGEPAARVYDRWFDGDLAEFFGRGGNILHLTALQPLGRPVTTSEGVTYHSLAHPDAITPEDGLLLFAEIEAGETVVAMRSTVDALIAGGGQVVERALRRAPFSHEEASGALLTYCGGCMLALGDRAPEVSSRIQEVVPGLPFIGVFTFGEQGKFAGGGNMHSNLMISAIVFGR